MSEATIASSEMDSKRSRSEQPVLKREEPADAVHASQTSSTEAKKARLGHNSTNCSLDDDDDVQVVAGLKAPPPPAPVTPPMPNNSTDVQILGSTGENPLSDFPHARENCVLYPFKDNPALHCPNCFCYVCDKQAADCNEWNEHSQATHGDYKWRQERLNKRRDAGTAASSASASLSTTTTSRSYSYSWYQPLYQPRISVSELLQSVTRIYPQEHTPPRTKFVTDLKHYQKQSLAFMLNVEKTYPTKSGWLCSEVGMGKTAVAIALIVSNPMSPEMKQPSVEEVKQARFQKDTMLDVKATIVITSTSLLGQWEDEIRKHAPHLVVYRYHTTRKLKLAELAHADVIVSTATFDWATVYRTAFCFHRVIVDESHLIGKGSMRASVVCDLATKRSWCVTATPATTSLDDLDHQIRFLDLQAEHSQMSAINFLQKYMIRHVKAQRINGAPALALPKATTTTKMVSMTTWERETFAEAIQDHSFSFMYRWGGVPTSLIESHWYSRLINPITCEDSSKLELLKADLRELLAKEPNMRVVVFTGFAQQQRFAKKAIDSLGLKTYSLHSSNEPKVRDRYIREFQSLDTPGPAVFLVTIRSGSVGITLTAASHVILLEPCIDPSYEVQAAGRIHRLGQTRQVGVTKYVFRDSCESNILKLHQKVERGEISFTTGMLSREAVAVLKRDLHY